MKRKSYDYDLYNTFVNYLDPLIISPDKYGFDDIFGLIDEYMESKDRWMTQTSSEMYEIIVFLSKIDKSKSRKEIIGGFKKAYDMFKRVEFPD